MSQWIYVYRQWMLRELQSRYRTSIIGGVWLILQPLMQILLFTLVFYQFFKVRWPMGDGSATEYGLQVFVGLTVYSFIAEVIGRSPASIWTHPYLVTKIRFPLALLPAVGVGAAAFQMVLALLLVVPFSLWRGHGVQLFGMLLVFLPLGLYALGLGWFLGALAVYIRDVAHLTPSISSLLLFLTPIFYPASMVSQELRWLLYLNPLAWAVEALRAALLHGAVFDFSSWSLHCLAAGLTAALGWWFFQRVRPGFSDVL